MSHAPLYLTLVLLAGAVLVIGLFNALRLPSILGYMTVGVLLGPHVLGWLPESSHTRLLAELGVVFLLFFVGLEFSLTSLLRSRRNVLGLGSAQVVATAVLFAALAYGFDVSPAAAFIIGGSLAMSSTAIVLRQLGEQHELATRHGRLTVAVLIFQDIATLPFLVLLPQLAPGASSGALPRSGWVASKTRTA